MRLLPRRGDREPDPCDCRLCRPDPEVDPADRKALQDVQEHGVHVVLVADSQACSSCGGEADHEHDDAGEPDFAYTVGLWHQRRHPDLLMTGLPSVQVMHSALNELSRRVLVGEVLRPGGLWEDVLRGVPVTVEELRPEARAQTTTWSTWFHRRDVPVLQVVWPDTEGVFAWQGGSGALDERQPPQWRVPGPRSGALAEQASWPFPVPRDQLAFTCRHVLDGELPALYVQRDRDATRGEDWVVSCGGEHEGSGQLLLAHLSHLVTRSPGLREVADLSLDHLARREDSQTPWQRWQLEPEEG